MGKEYSKTFKEAFKFLHNKLDTLDLARYLKITPKEVEELRIKLGLKKPS